MSKTLVLAEKPSVGRDIAKVLRCTKQGNGFLEGNEYIVTWALGHLVTLASPEKYNKKYESWNLEDLPMLPSELKLEVIKKTSKQFFAVKSQLTRKDVKDIVIATDAGREGELVARWIIEKAQCNKPIKRLWISSVTDKAIKDGFNKLQPGKNYEALYASAVARSAADWYVGLNATRALTCKYNAQLSCGRVQTPTLAIIAKREEEIKTFRSKDYYIIDINLGKFNLTWQDTKTNNTHIFDKELCNKIIRSIDNKKCEITQVIQSDKKTYPPLLYDLTELQRDANRLYSYSAKETLSIMQTLYERHKLLTYPRTDSKYLTSDIVDTLKDRIDSCSFGSYKKTANKILSTPIKANKSFVDNSKVSDHHAIIPTDEPLNLTKLNDKERKIYELVVRRFLSVLLPPFEYTQTTIIGKIGEETFSTKGKVVKSLGWKEIYNTVEEDDDELSDSTLPKVTKGEQYTVQNVRHTTKQTTPPPYFNEGSLLSAMENPSKYMDTNNNALLKTLNETGGLGTVATRADIIEKLFSSFLIEKRGNHIHITQKGIQLLDLVPDDLKSPILTAKWEQELDHIKKGQLDSKTFINNMKDYTKKVVTIIKNNDSKFQHTNVTGDRCPECGKFMLEVNGKKGKLLVCQDRDCGHRKSVSIITNARCPNCHKKMQLVGEGEGQRFICKCGHREKLSSFNENRKDKGKNVTKKDVSNYLKQQKKQDEPMLNSAFADAFKNLKK
ncbi:DNA topoisomerase-3 [Natranaerovirga pectinivora]|uniref:DNA topoisomerase 3 n=1 Tax=Natranaerovirga pectinivora TaxID=682400 RepID=A0A4R3MJR7_9FIRM|nr:DNA topoisomerase III [Natranaerovirga pectinivora]TCT13984.1 DNA topoisomerase-3 [Natranaerovirga pectinivora]